MASVACTGFLALTDYRDIKSWFSVLCCHVSLKAGWMGFAICGRGWQSLCPSWVTGHIPVVQQEPMRGAGSSHNGLHKDWKVILKYQISCCILFVFENNENTVMFNNTVKTTRGTLKIPYVQNESHYVSWQLYVFLSDWWTHQNGRNPPQKILAK